jgi:ABC-type nitrate/sulfonate/bicarbonate transport system permease component
VSDARPVADRLDRESVSLAPGSRAATVVVAAAVLAGWHVLATVGGVPALLLPAPATVAATLVERAPEMYPHVRYTGYEVVLGWGLGTLVGVLLALALALARPVRLLGGPVLLAVQVVPMVVFAPLLILLFDATLLTRTLIAALLTFFPVTVATLDGLRSVPAGQLALLRSVGAPRWRRVLHVRVPNAVPTFVTGLKLATPVAVQGVILAEFLAAERGIGHQLLSTAKRFDTPLLFAYVLVLAALGLTLFAAVAALERRVRGDDAGAGDLLESTGVFGDAPIGVRGAYALAAGALVVAAWHAAATGGTALLPPPASVAATLAGFPALFLGASLDTLAKFGVGWGAGAALGLSAGGATALHPRLRSSVEGSLMGLRAVPDLAVVPLLLVWVRISFEAAVVLVAIAAVFPVTVGAAAGLRRMPAEHADLLELVDAAPHRRLAVRFRHAVPPLFAGVKLSVVRSLAAVVVAEWFVAENGVGVLLLQGMTNGQPPLTFAAAAVLFGLGLGLFGLVAVLQRRVAW